MEVANLTHFAHLAIHDEPPVQINSKIVNDISRLQNGVDGWHIAFSQEVGSPQPDELGFVGVEFAACRHLKMKVTVQLVCVYMIEIFHSIVCMLDQLATFSLELVFAYF